ncbi:hypothetical protein E5D57_001635 [Metarhizium anisopliae]|nr:hypothetical protein E5D57_001635 [Metarhizium anisopliae]
MPEGGLKQSMLNQSVKLRLTDIICGPGNERDVVELENSRYLVYNAIKSAFPDSITMSNPPSQQVMAAKQHSIVP